MKQSIEFWDALAPYHAGIEDNYLNRASIRQMLGQLAEPVLVAGAGQGLIVAEIKGAGLQCDGLDSSAEMVRFAHTRRGLNIIHANANCMPFAGGSYATVFYATGVIDFMADEAAIRAILEEGRRVLKQQGRMFVAFYRISDSIEELLLRVGWLKGDRLYQRAIFESYLLTPWQTVVWISNKAKIGAVHALAYMLWSFALSNRGEKKAAMRLQKLFATNENARALINSAPETVPYRDETEIRNLFERLGIPLKQLWAFRSCYIAQIQS